MVTRSQKRFWHAAVAAWVIAIGAAIAGVAWYVVVYIRIEAYTETLQAECEISSTRDSTGSMSSIELYHWPAMIVGSVGFVAAISAIVLSRRRHLRVTASVLTFVTGALFLLTVGAYVQRNDMIGPFCGG